MNIQSPQVATPQSKSSPAALNMLGHPVQFPDSLERKSNWPNMISYSPQGRSGKLDKQDTIMAEPYPQRKSRCCDQKEEELILRHKTNDYYNHLTDKSLHISMIISLE